MSSVPARFPAAPAPITKKSFLSECLSNTVLNSGTGSLEFSWAGPAPRGGQFFLVRPERTGVFLGRPLSAAAWEAPPEAGAPGVLRFLAARRGRGMGDLLDLRPGERAEISGPLGNTWAEVGAEIPEGAIALIAGGVGIASLTLYAREMRSREFDFYAGFRSGSFGLEGIKPRSRFITSEDGSEGLKGRILDFFSPIGYSLVCVCGPEPMLKAAASVCEDSGIPCLVSLERHMACGVGACLGCTVSTWHGNRRCCADGPVFNAQELRFDE